MVKPLRRNISLFVGTIGVVFGILLLPLSFNFLPPTYFLRPLLLYEAVPTVFGFLNGAMLVAGIGILENWWRTRPKSTKTTAIS